MKRILTLAGVVALAVATCWNAGPAQAETNHVTYIASAQARAAGTTARVSRVIDGDTIDVVINGATERVRMIGIDTPETKHPQRPVECYGPQATEKTASLVAGKTVTLVKDVSERDRYGRLLRYVYVDGAGGHQLHVNWELVWQGYANSSSYPPDVAHQEEYRAAERAAREQGRGLWSAKTCNGSRTAPAQPKPAPAPARGNCDPSYPDFCLTPGIADLDCGDIRYRRFRVYQPDPHRFDGDRDGVGCE